MTQQLLIRLESGLKNQLAGLSKREGKTSSEVVRGLIRNYVEEQDIESHIDDLWRRIGKNLKTKGHSEKTVAKAVQDYRKSRR